MTALAEVAIAHASAQAHREAAERYGEPRDAQGRAQSLLVAGLGKLGGCELNVSSDVDLVFLYAEDGDTAGARPATNHEFFAMAARRLIALLAEDTAEGQVFRVDMRLRPYGDSGPLVASFASLESYFVSQARPWERYAWLKARALTGPGDALAALVHPFVYRRYLDYGMLDSLRELHGRISEAATQRGKADDIKVGAGGIREIEFAVQLFQMVRGGRDRDLQTTSTRTALERLVERGLIDPARGAALREAYAFLRKLEHRLQYHDDQQTQALPRDEGEQALDHATVGIEADFAQALLAHLPRIPPGEILRQPIHLREIEPERLADIAHRALRPVADDGRGDGRTAAAVFAINILDDFFAPLVLEVDVDVGRLVTLLGQETLEQHFHARRIDLCDAQAVAHRGVGRGAAALTQDALIARKANDVVDGEEEGLVMQIRNQRELVLDQSTGFGDVGGGAA